MVNKENLLKEICDFYNYDLTIKDNKVITDGGMKEYYFEFNSIDEALKDWSDTMEESNECNEIEGLGEFYTWSKTQIGFIKVL